MRAAFSLIELSIVLVILGLLTGGILTGQNLIRAAELRSVTTEFQTYQTAVMTFRDKYFALPGDMRNATDFWESAGGSGTIGDGCEAATGTGTQTCNGDGDGILLDSGSPSEYVESFTFWQHLVNSGLIEGSYTGIAGNSSVNHSIAGENAPTGKLGNTAWHATNRITPSATHFNRSYGKNTLYSGTVRPDAAPYNPSLRPEELWNIDKKVDDGKPAQGSMGSLPWNNACTDATDADDLGADYNLNITSLECYAHFNGVF